MLVQNRPLESRPPRLWTVSVTCAALLLVAAVAALTISPQAAAQGAKKSGEAASSRKPEVERGRGVPLPRRTRRRTSRSPEAGQGHDDAGKLGIAIGRGPVNDEEMDKLIKEKKYEFVKTFDSKDGEKQYVYRFTYPDGRRVNRNFSMPLDNVTSWADYREEARATAGAAKRANLPGDQRPAVSAC